MQKGSSEIAVVQISRTEYITKCYRNTVDQIPQKRSYGPEINGNPIVYIADLTFEIRARAVRHVIMEHTRELKWAIPLKDISTCSSTDIYHMCRTRHFRWKGRCATAIQLLNTPHDRRCFHGRQAMTSLWCSSINTLCFALKAGA